MVTAWIAGGSGLVGGELLKVLLEDDHFSRVVSVGRRKLSMEHPKLVQIQTEFTSLDHLKNAPAPEVAFCCLGTTIRKAGFKQAFRMVDHDSVLAFAEEAKALGAVTFLHVTALGANPTSRVFYNSVKGEAERDVSSIGFPSVYALRPSLLDGNRIERRTGEKLALLVGRVAAPVLGKYRPTLVPDLVATMVLLAKNPAPGSHVVEAWEIREHAKRWQRAPGP